MLVYAIFSAAAADMRSSVRLLFRSACCFFWDYMSAISCYGPFVGISEKTTVRGLIWKLPLRRNDAVDKEVGLYAGISVPHSVHTLTTDAYEKDLADRAAEAGAGNSSPSWLWSGFWGNNERLRLYAPSITDD